VQTNRKSSKFSTSLFYLHKNYLRTLKIQQLRYYLNLIRQHYLY